MVLEGMEARFFLCDLCNLRNLRIFRSSLNRLCRFQDLFWPGPDPVILCKIHPAHSARGIQKELGRPGNVLAVNSLPRMDQVVAANRFRFRIGKKGVGVRGFLTEVARDLGRVYANRDRANADLMKLIQALLNAPQLGVA